ncbi:MAG: alpha/beta hydrolase [Chloroflexota bacterium]|nr:alpha/beta hydrolase [Chloroflexota bacterium]
MIRTPPENLEELEAWIEKKEDRVSDLRDSARATIIWANQERKKKTEYTLLYLHGFKACHPEGHPVHRQVAHHFGWNLFLARLKGHGLTVKKPLSDFEVASLKESAAQALEISKRLGDKVIIMGTSTGGSLGLFLSAQPELKEHIKALVLYSPLIEFYGISQRLLGNRWGRSLLRFIPGGQYLLKSDTSSKAENEIWYHTYALNGALALGAFIQEWMKTSTFRSVNAPLFTGFYYKNQREQDKVVSVKAIKKMFREVGTSKPKKKLKNYPEAGTHVISSGLISKSIPDITNDTIQFLSKNLVDIPPDMQ